MLWEQGHDLSLILVPSFTAQLQCAGYLYPQLHGCGLEIPSQPHPHFWTWKPSDLSRRAHLLLAKEVKGKASPAPVATLAEGGTPGTAQIRPKYSHGFGVCCAPVMQAPVVWAVVIRLVFADLLPGCFSVSKGCALNVDLVPWQPSPSRSLPIHSRELWVWRAGWACPATHRNLGCLWLLAGGLCKVGDPNFKALSPSVSVDL